MPCPKCNSDRLKLTDKPVAGDQAKQLRYTCSDCGWIGWRQRLERRKSRWRSLLPTTGPMFRAYVFFGFVVLLFLVTEIFFMRGCSELPPPDTTQGLATSQGVGPNFSPARTATAVGTAEETPGSTRWRF